MVRDKEHRSVGPLKWRQPPCLHLSKVALFSLSREATFHFLHKMFSPESRTATNSLPMIFCVNRVENQLPMSPTATFY